MNIIFHVVLAVLLVACTAEERPYENGGDVTGDNGGGSTSLVPPAEVKNSNLFLIDFFSTLEDEG